MIKYKDKILSNNIKVADTFLSRLIGLMFKEELIEADGLLLDPCNSIHTCFMNYSLDVVFINSQNVVVKIIRDLKPWRFTRIYFKAKKVLEFPAGKLPIDITEGEKLEVINV